MASQRKAGAVLGYANIVVKNIVNLLYTPMLLAFVGQVDYGVFQTANNFIVSLQLLTFGFDGAYVRFYMLRKAEGDEDGIRRLNGMYLVLYLIICSIAIGLGLLFSAACGTIFSGSFTSDEVGLASAVMSVLTFNVATTLLSTVFDAYIVAHERFTFQQSRQMFTTLATPGLALVMLWLGFGVVGVSAAQLVVNLALLLLNARYAIGRLGMRFDVRHIETSLFKAVAVFSGWLFLNQLFDLITMNVPSVILAALSGAVAVAVFAVAAQLRSLFYSLSTTISSMFVPLINKLVAERDDNAELTRLMTRVGRYQALAWWYVLGGFVVLGQWFIRVWAGPDYMDAYWYTLAMVIPATVPLIQNTGIEIQKAKNRHKPRSIAYTISAVIDLGITLALAPSLGGWAAVIGYVFYVLSGPGVFMNIYYQRNIGLDMGYFWRHTLPIILAFAVASGICIVGTRFLPVTSIAWFIIWGLFYTAACFAILWPLVLNDDEKGQFRRVFAKLRRCKAGD
jgi:O-antigen/teichoic acid export membrane protein